MRLTERLEPFPWSYAAMVPDDWEAACHLLNQLAVETDWDYVCVCTVLITSRQFVAKPLLEDPLV